MHETPAERAALQELLDSTYESAGSHLRSTIEESRRLSADGLLARLDGMRLFVVATVAASGRPLTGPVDAFFVHGELWFGSSPDSVKMRHLRARPFASATYLDGIRTLVTMHGTTRFENPRSKPGVAAALLAQYPDFEDWAPVEYVVLTPQRLVAASFGD